MCWWYIKKKQTVIEIWQVQSKMNVCCFKEVKKSVHLWWRDYSCQILNSRSDTQVTLFVHILNMHHHPPPFVLPNEDKADVIQSNTTPITTYWCSHTYYMSGNFTRKSHLKEKKKKKLFSGNSEVKFLVCLSTCHTLKAVWVLISGERVCQACRAACPRLPAQPEPREDVIPRGWLEAFRWETPRSLFKLLSPPAFLPCQTPKTRGDGSWEKQFFLIYFFTAVTFRLLLILAILWCVRALKKLLNELLLLVSVFRYACVCMCLIFHLSALIVTTVLWFITWSDSVNSGTNPNHCYERERKMVRVERIISFHW